MSQIDQAFIKAYRQQASQSGPITPSTQTAAPLASGTLDGGAQFRVDAAHPPQRPAPGARVPTPHLQMPLGHSALSAGQAADEAKQPSVLAVRVPSQHQTSAPTQPPSPSPSIWSPRSRLSPATRSHLQPPEPSPQPTPVTEAPQQPAPIPFLRIEETLLRLEGVACERQTEGQFTDETDSVIEQAPAAPSAPQAEAAPALKLVSAEQANEIELPKSEESATDSQAIAAELAPPEAVSEIATISDSDNSQQPVVADAANIDTTPMAEPIVEPAQPETTSDTSEQPETTSNTERDIDAAEDMGDADDESKQADEGAQTGDADAAPTFQAVWEVDAFQWPEVTDRLRDAAEAELTAAGNSLAAGAQSGAKLLAVTGAAEGAGATTLALTLARNLAAAGMHVALVDANFDRPMLAERLGVRVQDGWEAALTGSLPLEEVCITSVGDGVTLVPLIDGSGTTATQASLHAAGLLTRLAKVFDVVLIDAGSGSENVAAVATSSDGVLDMPVLVAVDDRHQDRPHTLEMIGHLKQCALGNIQVAETFAA